MIYVCAYQVTLVDIRGQLSGVRSLLPHFKLGMDQASSPTETFPCLQEEDSYIGCGGATWLRSLWLLFSDGCGAFVGEPPLVWT